MAVVEVFKTNVIEEEQARKLVEELLAHFPQSRVNFDLQDCDKILRVEGKQICPDTIIGLVQNQGYQCEALE